MQKEKTLNMMRYVILYFKKVHWMRDEIVIDCNSTVRAKTKVLT